MRVVIAGGGTTGHLSPGLAVAAELGRRGATSVFVGSARGPEARLVPEAGYRFHPVHVIGRGRGIFSLRNLRAAVLLGVATVRCLRLMITYRPQVVVGTGGYASLPAVLAARLTGTPIVLHEQNSVPGMANRVALRFARAVGASFAGSEHMLGARAVLVGNPVREGLNNFDRDALRPGGLERFGLEDGRPTLLAFGGSQGARSINAAIIGAYDSWRASDLQILLLCGQRNLEAVEGEIGRLRRDSDRVNYRVVGYCDVMDLAYACADLAVCRSGASTVAELAAVGLPAILVPLPVSLDDDQLHNAEAAVEAGGGILLLDKELNPERIVEVVDAWIYDHDRLREAGAAIHTLHRPDAGVDFADLVESALTT